MTCIFATIRIRDEGIHSFMMDSHGKALFYVVAAASLGTVASLLFA